MILKDYKFTVTENTPIEEDIALDPELLGRVFENLLASYNPETKTTARKQTGSFYTPREIVDYMVDESLKAYLKQKLVSVSGMKEEDADVGLNILFSYTEKEHAFNNDEKHVLIEAIDTFKVLDPACGSGAFPMGILHKLVYVLHKLDPDNELWRERQRQNAIKETEHAFKSVNQEERETRLKDINNVFENNAGDYGRKLYLIENCIYGVDIQPIATQISKLRFFISLIVDQQSNNDKAHNYGVLPLPNLETKFLAANTLIAIKKPKKGDFTSGLFDDSRIDVLEKELQSVRHRLFSAKTPSTKRTLRKEDKRLREEMGELLIVNGWGNDTAHQMAAWDPYDQNARSPFFDIEWMFGLEKGFDVVIGNPPYGGSYSSVEKQYFLKNYKSTKTIKGIQKGSLDTYTLFIEKGFDVLSLSGNLNYIVPISITSSDSLTGVHRLLENNCAEIKISSYSVRPQPVFENAVINTSILFFKKTGTKCEKVYATKMYRKSKNFDLQHLINNHQFIDVYDCKLVGRYPKISLPIEKSILKKVFSQSKSIGDLILSEGAPIYYRTTGGRYYKVITPYSTGSTKETVIYFEKCIQKEMGAILSSSLYFWFYQIFSNNLDLKYYEIISFKIPPDIAKFSFEIKRLYDEYLVDIEKNVSVRQTKKYANIESFKEYKIGRSKKYIDRIDDLIGPLYGFTNQEIDFLKNYEIDYRLSSNLEQ